MTPAITIQPFTADHAGMPFTCGVRRIDDYFSQGAHIQKERLARLFVALDRPTRRTALGFYALHNMDIEADVVPPPLGAKLRRNSQVGAVYTAMLAVASNHQGKGLGSLLLANALKRIKRLADDSGIEVEAMGWGPAILSARSPSVDSTCRRIDCRSFAKGAVSPS